MKKSVLVLIGIFAFVPAFAQQGTQVGNPENAALLRNNVTRVVAADTIGLTLGSGKAKQTFKLESKQSDTNVYIPMISTNQASDDALIPDEMLKDVTLVIKETDGFIDPDEFFFFEKFHLNNEIKTAGSDDGYTVSYFTTGDAKGKLQTATFEIKRLRLDSQRKKSVICSFKFQQDFSKLDPQVAKNALKAFYYGVNAYSAKWEKAVKSLVIPPLVK